MIRCNWGTRKDGQKKRTGGGVWINWIAEYFDTSAHVGAKLKLWRESRER